MQDNKELVGLFADRGHFEAAVAELLKSGFERADLSVLSSHHSLDAVEGKGAKSWRDALVAASGELKYEGPLVAAGLIALATGQVGAALAGLIAAGVSGVALKEVLDEVASAPDPKAFQRAVEAGSVILWVNVADALQEGRAKAILTKNGASNIHLHERAKAGA